MPVEKVERHKGVGKCEKESKDAKEIREAECRTIRKDAKKEKSARWIDAKELGNASPKKGEGDTREDQTDEEIVAFTNEDVKNVLNGCKEDLISHPLESVSYRIALTESVS